MTPTTGLKPPATDDLATKVAGTPRLLIAAQWLACLVALGIVLPVEVRRWQSLPAELQNLIGWFFHINIDTTLPLLLLLAVPWFWRRRTRGTVRGSAVAGHQAAARSASARSTTASPAKTRSASARPAESGLSTAGAGVAAAYWWPVLAVGLISWGMSAWVGGMFDSLPPAYHDEYSYLFQAKTFLAGRLWFPSPPVPELFDQMHVLNEGRFASRYFPGTGMWLAPFLVIGHPYAGYWLAGAICAGLMFLIGRDLAGNAGGWIAGLVTAMAPGLAIFGNLLLAHHPTLVGLSLFLFAYYRMWRTQSVGWGLVAGCGLTFAMLCRPMTAAGVGFPYGVHFIGWCWWRPWRMKDAGSVGYVPDPLTGRQVGRLTLALGGPILLGLVSLFAYDRALTGNGFVTPYQMYTDTYTPRHVYGFNNVKRGAAHVGPRVIRNYDEWARNLTPGLAAENVWNRLLASWQWTLGIVPLAMVLVAGLVLWPIHSTASRLVLLAIVSLHVVHIPYWFDGIMHWHYVFESAPLWGLWLAVVSVEVGESWRQTGRTRMPFWWGAMIATGWLMAYVPGDSSWEPRLAAGVSEIRFSRQQYGDFNRMLRREVDQRPALVLIEPDPSDRHIDLVVNDPDLKGPVLRARYLPQVISLARLKELYPDRTIYLYRVLDKQWIRMEE